MDRFIEGAWPFLLCIVPHLKSNMDRFIVYTHWSHIHNQLDLKSNMDRFIALKIATKHTKNHI